MSKLPILFMVVLLLFFSLTYSATAARPGPANSINGSSSLKIQHEDLEAAGLEEDDLDGITSCEGRGDEEDCLMRRTLVAHTDYIYTQKKKKP